jgi:benzylsuccinate CoA-transferase BbsF subunit
MENKSMNNKALQGIKVAGFVTAGVGPLMVKSMVTHGATAIIVETQKHFNVTRGSGPFKDNKPGPNRSYSFALHNSDRYSLCIDLKHPRSKEVTEKLIAWADIFCDNWRTGVMEGWGLGYDEIKKINPGIIMLGCSHEGHTGPHSRIAGFGATLSPYSGLMHLTGWEDRPPVPLGGLGILPDFVAPRFAVTALMAALEYRDRTGKGQYIDISEFECAVKFQIPAVLDYTVNKRIMGREGNRSKTSAPHAVYRCKGEDNWCAISVNNEDEWKVFCKVIGKPELAGDKKFSSFLNRKNHEDELNNIIEGWTKEHDVDAVMQILQNSGIEAGKVRNMEDTVKHCPQLEHRHFWWYLDHKELGNTVYPGSNYLLSKTPAELKSPAPLIGEHNEYICKELLGIPGNQYKELVDVELFK